MNATPHEFGTILAREQGFGSVVRCPHGCLHVQVGAATIKRVPPADIRGVGRQRSHRTWLA